MSFQAPIHPEKQQKSSDRTEAVRLTVLTCSIIFSCWLFVLQLTATSTHKFLEDNELEPGKRTWALVLLALLEVATLTGTWLSAQKSLHTTRLWVHRSAPLVIVGALPMLFSREAWENQEIEFLCFAACTTLALERVLHLSISSFPNIAPSFALKNITRFAPLAIATLAIGYYILIVSGQTILTHHRLSTATSDLGEFNNLFFNAYSGNPFRAPAIEGDLENWSALKVHAEFILYALLPFYALNPGPETLLVIQTVVVALTGFAVFALASKRFGSWGGLVFCLTFLMWPAVQQPNFYDFHFNPVGMFFVMWTLVFLDRYLDRHAIASSTQLGNSASKRVGYALVACFVCALTSREDVAFGLAVLGVLLALSGRASIGIKMAACAGCYFVLMKFIIMPQFGKMWFSSIYNDLKAPGSGGFGAVILTVISNPLFTIKQMLTESRLLYLLHLSVPILCLWVRKPILWTLVLPALPFTLLVTNRPPMNQISFQYVYNWIPYVLAGSVIALHNLSGSRKNRQAAGLIALLVASISCSMQFGSLFGNETIRGGFGDKKLLALTSSERENLESLRTLVAMIPRSASVAATEVEGPHVSTREILYSLKFTSGKSPEYLLIGPRQSKPERIHIGEALERQSYGLEARKGPFTLLKRNSAHPIPRTLLRRFRSRN